MKLAGLLRVACVTGLVLISVAYAQEAPNLPTVEDLLPLYNMEGDDTLDIQGVSLGQLRTEAEAALRAAYPDDDIRPQVETVGVSDTRGNAVTFEGYHRADMGGGSKPDGSLDTLEVTYTTAVSGERVSGLTRIARFTEDGQLGLDAFLTALEDKYGEPSHVENMGYGLMLRYIWFEGERITVDDAQWQSRQFFSPDGPNPASCERAAGFKGAYLYAPNVPDELPGCTIAVEIEITFGQRDDLIQMFRIQMTDYRRMIDNWLATNKVIEEAFAAATNAGVGAAVPAL